MVEPLPSSIAPRFIKQYPCGCSAGPGPLNLPDYCPDHGKHTETSGCKTEPFVEQEDLSPIPSHRVVGLLEVGMAIERAVAAERERCAKIAEAHSGCPVGGCDGRDCGEDIAEKIRSGE